jgi:hypothetical protein
MFNLYGIALWFDSAAGKTGLPFPFKVIQICDNGCKYLILRFQSGYK